jgi:two-component SAPR family response regulator
MKTSETERNAVGLTVFVVEDEALVALNLEDMLAELGCQVVGTAMRLRSAYDQISGEFHPDVAILDVNIAGEPVFDLARELVERGIPVLFATGYGRSGLPEEWHSWPILQKPYTAEEVCRGLAEARERHSMRAGQGSG